MSIIIKEVKTTADLKTFIYLPEKIHRQHATWLPPLYIDDEKFFSEKRNPAFKHNDTILLLALDNNRPVGRIMGIIPHDFNKLNNIHTARFSYFECYEDRKIFDALIHAVEDWARQKGCNQVIGPMGFSDKEPQGFVTKGFDAPTMMVTNCSFEFMKEFILQSNYNPHVELCQYDVPITDTIVERYKNYVKRVENNLKITVHEFTSSRKIKPFVKPVFNLINNTYQKIYGFTAVTEAEMNEFANRFLPLLNPRLVKIITDENNDVVAFIIAMPDLSEGIRKARGRILPLGWLHLYKSFKKAKRLVLLLGSISRGMQGKGLDAVLATRIFTSAINLGFTIVDSHLIMRENTKMRGEIERLEGHKMYKEYTIYSKKLGEGK